MALTNIETTIILDLYDHDTTPTKIKAIALDSKTRYVLASLRNNGNVYDAGQDTSVTLTIIRPDNVGVQITGETRQIVDLAPEGEVTVYGVYAELTQTALAVKGTLRAQFMLTSGDQVLRTEIFAINCGEALDASTDTWAGEYQGYNLDELVQNVNETVAKVNAMEQDVTELKSDLSDLRFKSGLYGAKWDRTTNLLTRTRDAVGITTDTTNFVHKGSINPNYNNPFDQIYPWSEMRVVDVDLDMYKSGNYTLKQCIIAVAGDPDFTYEGSDKVFVGRYVPEFWHSKITDESGDEYLISQFARKGYKHVDEYVRGISFAIDDGNGGVTSGSDVPLTNIAVSAIQTKAKNSGFTIMDIDILDAEIMLYLVELADMNSQNALGDGCSSCYRENDVDAISNVVVGNGVTTFDITDSAEVQYMHIGAQMDIGATKGAVTYRGIIKAFEIDGSTEHITLDRELAVANGMIASIHGFSACEFNLTEQNIGSMSGYIGTNGKANAWYRGALLYANRYSYILGIYRQQSTNRIWICPDGIDPNDYDALNTSVHKDTETEFPSLEAGAWQTVGANAQNIDGLSAFMATGASSGSSASPVGDRQYVPVASTGDTILLFGCLATGGWDCGVFGGSWNFASGFSYWSGAALPVLKKLL